MDLRGAAAQVDVGDRPGAPVARRRARRYRQDALAHEARHRDDHAARAHAERAVAAERDELAAGRHPLHGDPGLDPQARRELAGAGHGDWAEVVLADLERAHRDVRALVDRIDVAFWGHGMIRPRTGSLFGGDRARRAAPVGKLHFAHTDLSGLALFEEAFDHGVRAAREVADALARGPS